MKLLLYQDRSNGLIKSINAYLVTIKLQYRGNNILYIQKLIQLVQVTDTTGKT